MDELYDKDEPYYLRVLWNNVKPGGRLHLGAVEDCFERWGAHFESLDMPINEKLREVRKHSYIIERTVETACAPTSGLVIKIDEAIKKAVGDGEEIDYSLVKELSLLFRHKISYSVAKELPELFGPILKEESEMEQERRKKGKGL